MLGMALQGAILVCEALGATRCAVEEQLVVQCALEDPLANGQMGELLEWGGNSPAPINERKKTINKPE